MAAVVLSKYDFQKINPSTIHPHDTKTLDSGILSLNVTVIIGL